MLIVMVVYDTIENNRTWMTRATLDSLIETVDLEKHRLIISDNGSCRKTQSLYDEYGKKINGLKVIKNGKNIGISNAVNKGIQFREKNEHVVKMDNDVIIHKSGWVEEMEEVFKRDCRIGICGLKRKDLEERPKHENEWYKSELVMIPQEKGQRWLIVEKVKYVIGTCQAYNFNLLDKIGYLFQMDGLYGFQDALTSIRSSCCEFWNVYLHGVEIEHIELVDSVGTEYYKWKREYSGKRFDLFEKTKQEYIEGKRNVHYEGDIERGR